MTAYLEPPCQHDPSMLDEYVCQCIYCRNCERWIQSCHEIRPDPYDGMRAWCHAVDAKHEQNEGETW